ncbi:MAG: 7-cyano-7-deazaguanine synthase QueC [Planctomycetia bacterium]
MKRAVCLLSGGMDSAVSTAEAIHAGFEVHALSFDYGQRHSVELEAARRVAAHLGVQDHRIVKLDLRVIGGSALTSAIAVPKDRAADAIGSGVPVTYVPARNLIFLSFALALAETIHAQTIYLGVNAIDYSGYPDCRQEFLDAFERVAEKATAAGAERGVRFSIAAPLVQLDKRGIVLRARELGVDLGLTHSCYDPVQRKACGRCDACQLRLKGFEQAGLADPVEYL